MTLKQAPAGQAWRIAKLPDAVYGCAEEMCATEVSYPPEMIAYYAGNDLVKAGWYCRDGCLDQYLADGTINEADVGPDLRDEIIRRENATFELASRMSRQDGYDDGLVEGMNYNTEDAHYV